MDVVLDIFRFERYLVNTLQLIVLLFHYANVKRKRRLVCADRASKQANKWTNEPMNEQEENCWNLCNEKKNRRRFIYCFIYNFFSLVLWKPQQQQQGNTNLGFIFGQSSYDTMMRSIVFEQESGQTHSNPCIEQLK